VGGSARLEGEVLKHCERNLHTVCKAMDDAGIRYWLDGGTLLGIVREQRLLPWDDDCDVFVDERDPTKLQMLMKTLKSRGLRVRVRKVSKPIGPFDLGDSRLIKVRNYRWQWLRGRSLIDLFLLVEKDGYHYWTLQNVLSRAPSEYFKELDRMEFKGYQYSIPANPERYLEMRFGAGWRTPVKEWDSFADDGAIVESLREG
jgi:hypothetical protein